MNRPGSLAGRLAAFGVLALVCLAAGIRPLVLEIGGTGPRLRVREGEVISLHYTQSMYGVPVVEHLRVENDRLALFEVDSTAAALEYLGIETRGPDNVRRVLREFSLPAHSVGKHELVAGGRRIALASIPADEGRILIRLARQPLIIYWIHALRGLWQ